MAEVEYSLPLSKRYYYGNNRKHEVNDLEFIIMLIFAAILILFLIYIFIILISSCFKKRRSRVDIDNSDYDSENDYVYPQMSESYRAPYAYYPYPFPPPPNYPPPPSAYLSANTQRLNSRRTSYPQYFYLVPCQQPSQNQSSQTQSTPIQTAGNTIPITSNTAPSRVDNNNVSNPPQNEAGINN